ncbi:MAG: DUF1844 domain-containing protein [candidate division WOR-3 bacterium]|nr:DUF1844 domain-containing protein [candidate division WOR-3 bacterium]
MAKPDFVSVIYFFATIALQHLGVVKNPLTDKVEKNLNLAKYTIDTLDLINEKTKGNLTKEEESLISSTLSDLKLTYVKEKEREESESKAEEKPS